MGVQSRSQSRSDDGGSRSPSPAPKRTNHSTDYDDVLPPEKKMRKSYDSENCGTNGKESSNGRCDAAGSKRSPSGSRRLYSQQDPSALSEVNGDGERSFLARTRSKSGSPTEEGAIRDRSMSPSRGQRTREVVGNASRSRSRSHGRRSGSRSRSGSRARSRSKHTGGRRSRSRSRSPRGRGDAFARFNDEDGYRLHVADLDVNATKKDLERIFGKFGPLKEIWMARSVPCFAFVVYRYRDDADEALRKTDGTEVVGRRVRVTAARPRTRGMGRRGFDPSMRCYQCGDRGHFSRDCPDSRYGYKRPPSPRGGRYHTRRDAFYDDRRERDRDRRY